MVPSLDALDLASAQTAHILFLRVSSRADEFHHIFILSRRQALPFFQSMGFRLPERKGIADFLQEVTSSKEQHKYWAGELAKLLGKLPLII